MKIDYEKLIAEGKKINPIMESRAALAHRAVVMAGNFHKATAACLRASANKTSNRARLRVLPAPGTVEARRYHHAMELLDQRWPPKPRQRTMQRAITMLDRNHGRLSRESVDPLLNLGTWLLRFPILGYTEFHFSAQGQMDRGRLADTYRTLFEQLSAAAGKLTVAAWVRNAINGL